MAETFQFPAEPIDLPSKGWFYSETSPLSSGRVDIKYMTTEEENIITSQNLIDKGLVFDRLLQSLIINKKIKYNDLLIGDRNGLMVAARVLGYGKDYPVPYTCPNCEYREDVVVDLIKLESKTLEFTEEQKGKNLFTFELPISKRTLEFQLLTVGDEASIDADVEALKKINNNGVDYSLSVGMKKSIISIDGNPKREFVNVEIDRMLVQDSKAFREHAKSLTPDLNMSIEHVCPMCADRRRLRVPLNLNFFWPNPTV